MHCMKTILKSPERALAGDAFVLVYMHEFGYYINFIQNIPKQRKSLLN